MLVCVVLLGLCLRQHCLQKLGLPQRVVRAAPCSTGLGQLGSDPETLRVELLVDEGSGVTVRWWRLKVGWGNPRGADSLGAQQPLLCLRAPVLCPPLH